MTNPKAEQALAVAAARHALKTIPENSDLLDKVRAIESAVRALKSTAVAFVAVLLLSVNGWGCAAIPEQPFWAVAAPDHMRADATEARDRIFAASGIWFDIDPEGAPIVEVETFTDLIDACAGTVKRKSTRKVLRFEVDPSRCRGEATMVDVLTHEFMHALVFDFNGHAEDGVFAPQADADPRITENTLDTLCEHAFCTRFEPER